MVVIQRNMYGYYVECQECAVVIGITREDAEDGHVECENCGYRDRLDDYDGEDEDADEDY